MNKIIYYIFVLTALLIIVSYFKGSTAVLDTLFTKVGSLSKTLSGRNEEGNFADYPQGA